MFRFFCTLRPFSNIVRCINLNKKKDPYVYILMHVIIIPNELTKQILNT